jgi:hypothetical protein
MNREELESLLNWDEFLATLEWLRKTVRRERNKHKHNTLSPKHRHLTTLLKQINGARALATSIREGKE